MADLKISQLNAITTLTPATDVLPVVDVTGTTKKITTNQILGSGGTATLASATISGDLTVDTSTLKVDSTNNRVGIGTASPTSDLDIFRASGSGITSGISLRTAAGAGGDGSFIKWLSGGSNEKVAQIDGVLNGTDVGYLSFQCGNGADAMAEQYRIASSGVFTWYNGAGGTRMTLDSTGLGVGTVPANGLKLSSFVTTDGAPATSGTTQTSGSFRVGATSTAGAMDMGTAGSYSWIQALDRTNLATNYNLALQPNGGNLLVGTTSGTYHTFRKNVAVDAGNVVFEIQGNGGATSSIYYSVSSYNANAANAASKFGRDITTLRSINAGGTVNASGADYAEYMVKCGDFVLAKGDVAGIDANGKLTNVFADAVSFVVKSTDPSYVGNDKWGVGLEGADLESARQLVDRIAFAGQVPVNVTGAKAGDYIVPIVDGTGIKGISVSKPTFDQYQLAVGKVIAIDADGRARIIVKVA